MSFTLDQPVRVTRGMRALGWAALVALLAGGVLVWGSTRPVEGADRSPGTAARSVDGVTMLLETERYGGPVAGVGLGGRLALLDGGCLGLSGTGGAEPLLLVFPPGTTLSSGDAGVRVRVPGDGSGDPRFAARTLRVGDAISGGSRYSSAEPVASYGGGLAGQTPASCRGYSVMPLDPGVELDRRG